MTIEAPVIAVRDLDFEYWNSGRWLSVLRGVSLTINRGEVFGLVGESGSGKSTLGYQMLGFRQPNGRVAGGQVWYRDTDLLSLDPLALQSLRGNLISFVPQNPTTALSPAMRIGRQIRELLKFHRPQMRVSAAGQRIEEILRLVGLPDTANVVARYPHQLSGGQQQRVCIAMALVCEPDLVVLDEPTTGLDVTTQEQIIGLLADLRSRIGLSMLYVTHDLGVIAEIADRVGVMYAGRIVEVAPTEVLFRRPCHPYTRGLIASVPQLDRIEVPVGASLRGLLKRDELPVGCPFQPRCEFAEESCATTVQKLTSVSPGHEVACQRWRSLESPALSIPQHRSPQHAPEADLEPILRLERLSLGYGGKLRVLGRILGSPPKAVVDQVTLDVVQGETLALVGESGSGKSTIARAICGMIRPLSGQMWFEGAQLPGSVRERPVDVRRRIQYIFQNPDASLNPRTQVGTILARPMELFFRHDRHRIDERIAAALNDVRLDYSYRYRYPDQLSGGERQRVAIARALIAEPALLLCDEILSALDVSVQSEIIDLLRRIGVEHQVTMLFISHDLAVVRNLADRIAVLYRGQVVELGDVEQVLNPPFHPYTFNLLQAVPRANARASRRAKVPHQVLNASAKGCVYAGRCPWQIGSVCETTFPPWQRRGTNHYIRCHIPAHELARQVTVQVSSAELIGTSHEAALASTVVSNNCVTRGREV